MIAAVRIGAGTLIPILRRPQPGAAAMAAAFSAASPGSPSPLPPLKRVGTHNGSFHCDEALGCFMIRLTDEFSDARVVRTRDSQVPPFSCSAIV